MKYFGIANANHLKTAGAALLLGFFSILAPAQSALSNEPFQPLAPATARLSQTLPRYDADWQRLATVSQKQGVGLTVRFHEQHGTPRFMSGKLSEPSSQSAEHIVTAFLAKHRPVFKMGGEDAFHIADIQADHLGWQHVKVRFSHRGVPVWPAEMMVHLNREGQIEVVNGVYRLPVLAKSEPRLDRDAAVALAVKQADTPIALKAEAELLIYDWHIDQPRYAWRVRLQARDIAPLDEDHFIDAITGEPLNRINRICDHLAAYRPTPKVLHAAPRPNLDALVPSVAETRDKTAVNCTVYPTLDGSVSRTVGGYNSEGQVLLINTAKAMFPGQIDPNTLAGTIYVLETQHTNQPVGISKDPNDDTLFNDSADTHAAGAVAYMMSHTYDWLQTTFNRNSWDGNGSAMRIFVNFRQDPATGYDNAYWNNRELVFGDGGQITRNWAFSLDFATHEICHAITSSSANLVYQFQSGALNEAFSDMYAATNDDANWLLGETITIAETFGAPALRSLADPSQGMARGAPGWQPSNMNEFVNLQANQDNGGVHVNSGIVNNAFFRLSNVVGRDRAIQIMHRALTSYLTRNSQFTDARAAAERAAADLYGATEQQAVSDAFAAVGIGGGGTINTGENTATTLYYPFTAPYERFGQNFGNLFSITNTSDQAVTGTVSWIGPDGAATFTQEFNLNAHATTWGRSDPGDQWVKVTAPVRVIGAYQHMTESGDSWSMIPATPYISNGLFIPHVATSPDFWTVGAVANVADTPSNVLYLDNLDQGWTINVNSFNAGVAFDFLEGIYGGTYPNVSAQGGLWGFFVNYDTAAEKILEYNMTGAEIFGRKDRPQSAGLIMDATSGRNLIFTHVAEDVGSFWTGYSIVNLTGESSPVNFLSFDRNGRVLANEVRTIGAFGKLLAVTGDQYVPAGTSWFMVLGLSETASIAGMELFGTTNNQSLAGFQATPYTSRKFYFPLVYSGAQNLPDAFAGLPATFTGISVVNPNTATATLTFRLYNHQGQVVSGNIQLAPGAKLLNTLANLFGVTDFYGHVEISSDLPVAGFSLSGFANGQELAANPMVFYE
ncbi:M4 family metallopeptidase [Acanthopleuribacter pedis]|uniref:M4 family metallopeptidase n=1 Tax=Acanthopleuribacter pedis TaxID=442870 RepID=A0A8J7U5C2_9BACT|nr:M4 family metallopeptidase [Acanthopleuribacter pedis]MBO1322398.1 M4 family metallopeptidase [Acanthopleuribacter pedis]